MNVSRARRLVHGMGSARSGSGATPIMQDRIAALAGELKVESLPGRGSTVTGRVPTRVMEASPP